MFTQEFPNLNAQKLLLLKQLIYNFNPTLPILLVLSLSLVMNNYRAVPLWMSKYFTQSCNHYWTDWAAILRMDSWNLCLLHRAVFILKFQSVFQTTKEISHCQCIWGGACFSNNLLFSAAWRPMFTKLSNCITDEKLQLPYKYHRTSVKDSYRPSKYRKHFENQLITN